LKQLLKYISIFIVILILPISLSACGNKVKAQTSITDYSNLDSLYLKIIDKMVDSPIVTDKRNTYIAIDFSSMPGISNSCMESTITMLKSYNNVEIESLITLEEKGMRGSDGSLKGTLIYIERIKLSSANHMKITCIAYNTSKNLVRVNFQITNLKGTWSIVS